MGEYVHNRSYKADVVNGTLQILSYVQEARGSTQKALAKFEEWLAQTSRIRASGMHLSIQRWL